MEGLSSYIKKHTMIVTFVVVAAFAVLFAGEFYLYHQMINLNKMLSEGLMQMKEEVRHGSPADSMQMMRGASPKDVTPPVMDNRGVMKY